MEITKRLIVNLKFHLVTILLINLCLAYNWQDYDHTRWRRAPLPEDALTYSTLHNMGIAEPLGNVSVIEGFEQATPSAISLAIVFDSTGSMGNDLKQVKIGSRRILQRHMQRGEANYIKDFVLVKVHDPGMGLHSPQVSFFTNHIC